MEVILKPVFSRLTFILLGIFVTYANLFAAPFDQYPSAIPLGYQRQAASDLVYQGNLLLPDEARELYETGIISDLSLLNPTEDSILWKNELSRPLKYKTILETQDSLEVIETIPRTETLIGQFALRALKIMPNGEKKVFRVIFDPKGHNNLLRKALLEKIGYQVPALYHAPTLDLKFKGVFSKNEMLKELKRGTFLDVDRWVKNDPEEETDTIQVQDVFVLEDAEDEFYNLSLGVVPSSKIRGRRLLNALLVPYNLVDIPESVNLMSWISGRIFNKQLVLDYEYGREFSTSYEDARWITRRILSLSLNDWQEIVAFGAYPKEVETLILHKILSRVQYLGKTFALEKEYPSIPFQTSPNLAPRLKKGKLTGGVSWEGYASQFAGTNPDDPLSLSEIWSFVGSKAVTNVITTLMTEFNKRFVPRTDLQFAIFDHQLDLAAKQFVEFLKTGEVSKVPFGFWHTKFFDMNLIANREVIAGNYMGSDNIVQLADTVGASLDLGIYLGVDGLPSSSMMAEGSAKLNLYRTYTSLRPIKSIKSSLKEPIKNLLVPIEKFLDAKVLDELEALGRTETDSEVLVEKSAKLLKEFKDNIGIGESVIIQTGLGPDLSFLIGQGLGDYAQAYLRLQDKLTVISRLHIYRASEDSFHIYNDPALMNSFDISLTLKAYVQVLNLGAGFNKGIARTEFFNLNLGLNTMDNDPFEANPDFFDNVRALSRALKWGKLDKARSVQKPWVINHDFSERKFNFDFFWWRHQRGKQNDQMSITHPSGDKKDFYRYNIGKRTGYDYQSFALEVVDSLLNEIQEIGEYVSLRSTNSGNPADTFQGHSHTRLVSIEGESSELSLENIYLSVGYRYKGWSASPQRINSIFKKLNNTVGSTIFSPENLIGSGKIRFYAINLNIAFYEMAFRHFLKVDRSLVRAAMTKHYKFNTSDANTFNAHVSRVWTRFSKLQKLYRQNNSIEFGKALANLVNDLEGSFTFEGLAMLSGGVDNLYVSGHMSGFRSRLENGDRDIFSHTLGMIGSMSPQGPLRLIQTHSGMSEGEFLLLWLMNRY